jgi:regulator of protease activity HflC (stomatin/prohibitin superfamily)
MKETKLTTLPGVPMLLIGLVALISSVGGIIYFANNNDSGIAILLTIVHILMILLLSGLFVIEPGSSRVVTLFGKYKGTVSSAGFHWANPFLTKRKVSLRIQNLNGERIKVNDAAGNPVEIATVVVWQVEDTYKACFDVENYEMYVALQTETALRHSATQFPYDGDEEQLSLRRNTSEVAQHLQEELQENLRLAGVKVLDAKLSHLAYAPEIAGVMLRRQQAEAVVAARTKIVDGAVGMVEQALKRLEQDGIMQLDEERKAAMVSNLMVVLCGEQAAQPVLNAGSLYT